MIPLDLSLFGTDPWWLVVIKVLVLFVVLLVWTIFNVWYERRLVAKMQHRLGPIMNGPFGLGQALADGAKLLVKEDFRPASADRILFTVAPLIAGTAAFTGYDGRDRGESTFLRKFFRAACCNASLGVHARAAGIGHHAPSRPGACACNTCCWSTPIPNC